MQKNFDQWNIAKKEINKRASGPFYRERQVFWCDLGVNIGFEQDGAGEKYARPVVILKGFNRHVCLAIPLTTSTKENPYYFPLAITYKDEYLKQTTLPIPSQSFAIISQIRLIDTKRLDTQIGYIPKDTFAILRKTIKDLL